MKAINVSVWPESCDGESAKEVLQWYIDETNKAIFEDPAVKENVIDMLLQLLRQIPEDTNEII